MRHPRTQVAGILRNVIALLLKQLLLLILFFKGDAEAVAAAAVEMTQAQNCVSHAVAVSQSPCSSRARLPSVALKTQQATECCIVTRFARALSWRYATVRPLKTNCGRRRRI